MRVWVSRLAAACFLLSTGCRAMVVTGGISYTYRPGPYDQATARMDWTFRPGEEAPRPAARLELR